MSEFSGEGYKPFPNTHSDRQEVVDLADEDKWPIERLEYKMNEYGEFLQRDDIMARARRVGGEILDRLIFEAACRDGVFAPEVRKLADETCEDAS